MTLLAGSLALFSGCQRPTVTTDTTEYWTTGTYFMWKDRVFNHFAAIDFSTFTFDSVLTFPNSADQEEYVTLVADGAGITEEVAAIFAKFDGSAMFPSHTTEFWKYEIRFVKEGERMVVTLADYGEGSGSISFLHYGAADLLESQSYPFEAFSEEITALFNLFEGIQELSEPAKTR
jgi:hypothetical protein